MTDTKLAHFIHRGYEHGGISCHHFVSTTRRTVRLRTPTGRHGVCPQMRSDQVLWGPRRV